MRQRFGRWLIRVGERIAGEDRKVRLETSVTFGDGGREYFMAASPSSRVQIVNELSEPPFKYYPNLGKGPRK